MKQFNKGKNYQIRNDYLTNNSSQTNKSKSPTLASLFENFIDKKALASKLGISISYVNKLMKYEGLPYIKLGRSVRFNIGAVAEWLRQRSLP